MNLHQAIAGAVEAHGETKNEKSGELYVRHPLRVMELVEPVLRREQNDDDYRIVAVLHDVVEDTGHILSRSAGGAGADTWSLWSPSTGIVLGYLTDAQADGLEAVTSRTDESYEAFIVRCAADRIGCVVKLADINDNLDSKRFLPGEKGERLRARYREAHRVLHAALTDRCLGAER